MVTKEQLEQILPYGKARIPTFIDALNAAMDEFSIDTPKRQAAFIAQIGHESGQFRYVEEIASGEAYEGRHDLGNVQAGDGVRFKGRGLIQITGRHNYEMCSLALFGDKRLLDHPDLLEQPDAACRSAGWFWSVHGLNAMADAGNQSTICRRINGGLNGFAERLALYDKAIAAMA